jgi:dipeptidyl aminopeptidase/acylaminoacyl peptidase
VELSSPGCASCQRLVVRRREGAVKQLIELASDEAIDFLRCDAAGQQLVVVRAPLDSHKVQRPGDVWRIPVDGGEPRKLTAERERERYPPYPALSPDGKSVVFSSARGGHTNLWEVAITAGGPPVQITSGTGPDLAPAVSPDGTRLIYDSDDTAVPIFARALGDGAAGGSDRRIAPTLDDVATIEVTPDGREVVASVRSQGGRRIVAVPLAGGDERLISDGATPALTADGREVAWSVEEGARTRLLAGPVDGKTRPREVATIDGRVTAMHAGADGLLHVTRALAGGPEAWKVPLAGGAPSREAPPPIAEVVPAPKGGYRIALAGRGTTVDAAHVVAPGKPLDDPAARILSVRLVAWAADGASFLYWDGTALHRFTAATGQDQPLGAAKDLEGLALAPDGKSVYFSAAVGHVRRRLIDNFAERVRPAGLK